MTPAAASPELAAVDRPDMLVRIPDQTDVPLTARVRRLLDSAPLRRLANIRQLGFVSYVYPGAVHHRLEHSLGVYLNALLFLRQLRNDPVARKMLDGPTIDAVILAALLHDLGHYPYCHPVEDLGLVDFPRHEELTGNLLTASPLRELLENDWNCAPEKLQRILSKQPLDSSESLAASLLSGPIDVDKLDYLFRDSLHAGVPYGRNFDSPRLINSLCLNRQQTGLAITTKGKTAAELMVFARYVMFSEVYWHHAVRSATAMFQRLFYECQSRGPWREFVSSTDQTCGRWLQRGASEEPPLIELYLDLFGETRQLYKRWGQFNFATEPELYSQLAQRPYSWLVAASRELTHRLARHLGRTLPLNYVLIDAPPVGLEVQFALDVRTNSTGDYATLAELSPVVSALAQRQFDDYVKQVRVFVHPSLRDSLPTTPLVDWLRDTIEGS